MTKRDLDLVVGGSEKMAGKSELSEDVPSAIDFAHHG
jgi:hypothetical protein